MGRKINKVSSHLYDLGSYQFNEDDDVSLLNFDVTTQEYFEELHKLRKTTNSTNFRLKSSSTVPQVFTSPPTLILYLRPYSSPSESTQNLIRGLEATIDKVNEKVRLLSGSADFNIGSKGFKVTEYDKVLTQNENCSLFFPVEMRKNVKIDEEEFAICINLDNPTSLEVGNQSNGCQGSHFGYTIITKSNGNRTRGHILINTFVGYPSRNEKQRAKTMKDFEKRTENSRVLNIEKLFNIAMNYQKRFPFCITTAKGVHNASEYSSTFHSDRIKKLPAELQVIHITFNAKCFELPDFKNKKLKPFFNE